MRVFAKLLGIAAALVSACSFGACNSDSGADNQSSGYCEVWVSALRECGILSEGRYEACENYFDAAEPCETECVREATCSELETFYCGFPTPSDPVTLCHEKCIGLDPFVCDDGSEIRGYAQCNFVEECVDGSDEADCDSFSNFTKCRNVEEQVSPSANCDGIEDCSDGSDELTCEVLLTCELAGTRDAFDVTRWQYCDGWVDCEDGSDEPQGCATVIAACE